MNTYRDTVKDKPDKNYKQLSVNLCVSKIQN